MLRFVLICCLTLLSAASWAQGPLVVSTHPLYLIAQKLRQAWKNHNYY